MKPSRIALIVTAEQSAWASCRVITPNLERAYRAGFGDDAVRTFHQRSTMLDYELWSLATEIHAARPERITFLDHRPNPLGLLGALAGVYGPRKLPPIVIHAYGDFSLDARDWLDAERVLRGAPVRFVAASRRQHQLVSRSMLDGDRVVDLCPFPVNVGTFKADSAAGLAYRERRGVKPGEKVIAYAGRLSLQKNTERLLVEFARLASASAVPLRLWLAGTFDDIGAPFFGVSSLLGKCYQSWHSKLMGLPSNIRARVEYLGSLNSAELAQLHNASDVNVSLSLHHDEDFGMAPAEALCCGVPTVLTDWGGYASFRLDCEDADAHCRLIPVHLDDKGLRFTSTDVTSALSRALQTAEGFAERSRRAKLYASRFSIEAASKIVQEIHSGPSRKFTGFHWRLRELGRIVGHGTAYPMGPSRGTFYEEIYGSYLRPIELAPLTH